MHGKISGAAPVFLYYPDENYFGTDILTVWVSDTSDSSQMTLTLNIQAVNDSPIVLDINTPEIEEDSHLTLTLTATDIDSNTLIYKG